MQAQLARGTGAESSAGALLVREAVAPLLARLDAGAAATVALEAQLGGVDRETGKLELAARALESAAVRMVELFERRDGILFDGPHRAAAARSPCRSLDGTRTDGPRLVPGDLSPRGPAGAPSALCSPTSSFAPALPSL